MAEVPDTLEGWYVSHDFRSIDWSRWKKISPAEQNSIVEEFWKFMADCENVEQGSSGCFSIIGHKADILLLHIRPTIDDLDELKQQVAQLRITEFFSNSYSYLSVTELSLYEAYARGGTENPEELKALPFVQQRLYFKIPEMRYISFYPMNKRRGETVNWYAADMEERRRMMREHGATGRKYHGKVLQMITGSTGLDDWEWGVTLFAHDPIDIKKLVYEMRFDEVSAKYADLSMLD